MEQEGKLAGLLTKREGNQEENGPALSMEGSGRSRKLFIRSPSPMGSAGDSLALLTPWLAPLAAKSGDLGGFEAPKAMGCKGGGWRLLLPALPHITAKLWLLSSPVLPPQRCSAVGPWGSSLLGWIHLLTLFLQVSHGPIGDIRPVRCQSHRLRLGGGSELPAGGLPQGKGLRSSRATSSLPGAAAFLPMGDGAASPCAVEEVPELLRVGLGPWHWLLGVGVDAELQGEDLYRQEQCTQQLPLLLLLLQRELLVSSGRVKTMAGRAKHCTHRAGAWQGWMDAA